MNKSLRWIDTHIHVSDIAPDGTLRERMLDDLLAVLDGCDADLRFVVSVDGPYFSRMVADPSGVLESSRFIHELVKRAPGRLFRPAQRACGSACTAPSCMR